MSATNAIAPNTDKPYGIAQIRAYILIQLDINKLNYDVWREFFETHCTSFGVLGHLDGSSVPTSEEDTQWKERNSVLHGVIIIIQWSFRSIS